MFFFFPFFGARFFGRHPKLRPSAKAQTLEKRDLFPRRVQKFPLDFTLGLVRFAPAPQRETERTRAPKKRKNFLKTLLHFSIRLRKNRRRKEKMKIVAGEETTM